MPDPNALLDLPPFPADGYAPLADRLKTLLATRSDVVFVQAEAILALEAAATSLGRPGLVALNIVTSPYGGYFGGWLQRAGATVHEVAAEAGQPISVAAVIAALDALPHVDLVAVVHAETSSGILNPLPEIAAAVRSRDALLVVDAVASVGGHELNVDQLGIDVCVIGPQKALAGPAGLSALSISARAWAVMRPQPVPSSLALLDLKANWLDKGRRALPGMPSSLEFWALQAALDRLEAETLPACIARHHWAAQATRKALRRLGAELWVERDKDASALATSVRVSGEDVDTIVAQGRKAGGAFSAGFGATAQQLVRLDHTGPKASRGAVLSNLVAYAIATNRDLTPATLADVISAE